MKGEKLHCLKKSVFHFDHRNHFFFEDLKSSLTWFSSLKMKKNIFITIQSSWNSSLKPFLCQRIISFVKVRRFWELRAKRIKKRELSEWRLQERPAIDDSIYSESGRDRFVLAWGTDSSQPCGTLHQELRLNQSDLFAVDLNLEIDCSHPLPRSPPLSHPFTKGVSVRKICYANFVARKEMCLAEKIWVVVADLTNDWDVARCF